MNKMYGVIAAITMVAASAACSTGDATTDAGGPGVDVKNKTITVSALAIKSGPAAALGNPINAGSRAYWESVNAAGGIDGWKIKYVEKDSGYQPQRHVQLYNEVKADSAVIISHGSPTTKAIQKLADRDKVMVAPASPDTAWGSDLTMLPVGTPYAFDVANVLDYLSDAGAKSPRIGVVYQNDELGADGMRGFEAAVKEYDLSVAARTTYKPGDTDFTAQVQELKSKKADTVLIIGVPSATGPIVGTAASLGFSPQWALVSAAFVEQLMTKDGKKDSQPTPVAAALQGAIMTSLVAPWGDPKVPGMDKMLKDVDAFAPDQTPMLYFTYGYTVAKVVDAALREAIAQGDFSREGMLKARQALGEVDLEGLMPSPSYSGSTAPPSRSSLIQRIDVEADGFVTTIEAGHTGTVAKSLKLK
jgi:ABC-type branched-subunit amino acid transport system substrate-binding protein